MSPPAPILETPKAPAQVLLLCGSLRKASLNGQLLALAPQLAPHAMHFHHDVDLAQLPLYDQDLEQNEPPASVLRFRAALKACQGVIIASPEYNYGVTGALKNAIDWASRPYAAPSLSGKCMLVWCATTGAASGFEGTSQLTTMLQIMGNYVVVQPRMVLQRAGEKLSRGTDGKVQLQDAMASAILKAQLGVLYQAIDMGVGPLCRLGNKLLAEHLASSG